MHIYDQQLKECVQDKNTTWIVESGTALCLLEKVLPEGKVLDAGCGGGKFERQAVEYDITGIDRETDITKRLMFPDDTFDAITAWEVFEHVENPRASARELYRVLKKGGWLLMSMPNIFSWENRLSFFFTGEMIKYKILNDHYNIYTQNIFNRIFKDFSLMQTEFVRRTELPFFLRFLPGGIKKRLSGRSIVYFLKKI